LWAIKLVLFQREGSGLVTSGSIHSWACDAGNAVIVGFILEGIHISLVLGWEKLLARKLTGLKPFIWPRICFVNLVGDPREEVMEQSERGGGGIGCYGLEVGNRAGWKMSPC
jgi:hypothetical protein